MQNETKDVTQEKIVTLYGKDYHVKESVEKTCGSYEDGYTSCAFFKVKCTKTEHGSLCGMLRQGACFYFIEVKNEL